jgi:hypothetical protein
MKCIKRLQHLKELEKELVETVDVLGDGMVLPVVAGTNVKYVSIAGSQSEGKRAKESKGKGKGKGKVKGKSDSRAPLLCTRKLNDSLLSLLGDTSIANTESESISEHIANLRPGELSLLLSHLLTTIKESCQATKQPIGFSKKTAHDEQQQRSAPYESPHDFIQQMLINVLPSLRGHTERVVQRLRAGDDGESEERPVDYYEDRAGFRNCLELIFLSLRVVLQCKELQQDGLGLVVDMLRPFGEGHGDGSAGESQGESSEQSSEQSISRSFDFFAGLEDCCLATMDTMMAWVGLLEDIVKLGDHCSGGVSGEDSMQETDEPLVASQELGSIADRMLRRDWANGDPNFKYKSAHIQSLLTIHLGAAQEVEGKQAKSTRSRFKLCEALKVYAHQVLPRIDKIDERGALDSHPPFTHRNFVHFVRPCLAMCETLIKAVSSQIKELDRADVGSLLEYVLDLVKVFRALVHLTKMDVCAKAPLLSAVVKSGGAFIKHFQGRIVHMLRGYFKAHVEQILCIFKELQQSTRQLQALCNHGKVNQMSGIVGRVPALKRDLEIIM